MPHPASRLLYVDNRTNNGQHKYAYTYDKVGNRQDMTVTDSGGTKIHVYTYDNIYQVTGVDYPPELSYLATDSTFNYDAAGNRTSVIDGGGTCTYTANNLNEYTAAGTTSYQYDDSGNMTHDGTYTYDYDPENRLIRVTKSGSPPPTTLAEALDLPLVYTTGGTREWLVNGSDYHTGLSSANSDNLNNAGESSWVETTVQAVGSGATLSFWWKSTEEGEEQNNTLDFRINGVVQSNGTLHGNSGPWEQRTYTLAA
ncbi:MAG: hypothetical protein M1376_21640, partial [Planctomycetes bacterium]|nr:hypothetical protein [Planctomycetota bacterium]